MYLRSLLTAALACAATFVSLAQTIPTPASSVDSGARALVAITPVDTSNLATKAEVNNAYNLANSAYNYAGSAYSYAGSAYSYAGSAYSYGYNAYINNGFNRPWARVFAGQSRGWYAVPGGSVSAWIDGNGYVYVSSNFAGTQALGYSSGSAVLSTAGSMGYLCSYSITVFPYAFDYYGQPGGWDVTGAGGCDSAGAGG